MPRLSEEPVLTRDSCAATTPERSHQLPRTSPLPAVSAPRQADPSTILQPQLPQGEPGLHHGGPTSFPSEAAGHHHLHQPASFESPEMALHGGLGRAVPGKVLRSTALVAPHLLPRTSTVAVPCAPRKGLVAATAPQQEATSSLHNHSGSWCSNRLRCVGTPGALPTLHPHPMHQEQSHNTQGTAACSQLSACLLLELCSPSRHCYLFRRLVV